MYSFILEVKAGNFKYLGDEDYSWVRNLTLTIISRMEVSQISETVELVIYCNNEMIKCNLIIISL
jgi:hypothetical protein